MSADNAETFVDAHYFHWTEFNSTCRVSGILEICVY